jgi:hypothetical protein
MYVSVNVFPALLVLCSSDVVATQEELKKEKV